MEQNIHQHLLKGTALEHRLLKVGLLLCLLLNGNSYSSCDSNHSDDNTSDGTTREATIETEHFCEGSSLKGVGTTLSIFRFIAKNPFAHIVKIFTVSEVISFRDVTVLVVLVIL